MATPLQTQFEHCHVVYMPDIVHDPTAGADSEFTRHISRHFVCTYDEGWPRVANKKGYKKFANAQKAAEKYDQSQ